MYLRGQERDESGYAMAALLVGMAVMALVLSVALPSWQTYIRREKEAELVFRGEQYARAIALYQRRYANAFPPDLDVLVRERFLRKKYRDPMTDSGEFRLLPAGQTLQNGPAGPPGVGARGTGGVATPGVGRGAGGAASPGGGQGGGAAGAVGFAPIGAVGGRGGIMGVASRSTQTSLRQYNGRGSYDQWAFIALQASTEAGAPGGGTATPGVRGGRGGAATPGLPGRGGPAGRQGGGARGGPVSPFGGTRQTVP